ncbi:hypothetical protein DFH29DRAFT_257523 [Suillus ampliporus]|nr:hypothetical protein DFH29DRAFT_257523 [Suillus ampliporus]
MASTFYQHWMITWPRRTLSHAECAISRVRRRNSSRSTSASAHSCPVCHEGVFANADLLNEHLVDHATPYYCEVCQTRYAEEEGLRQHYQDSPDDIHPSCTRCGLGFQDAGDYYDHTETIHPRYPVNYVMVHYLILGSFLCTT